MGAHSDNDIGCTDYGNNGAFQFAPEGTCASTTLTASSTYISDVNGVANFIDPIEKVFQCIAATGDKGCGFEQQLASIDRALGADGLGPPPPTTGDFLRKEAYLGIVMLTNEDDASAPHNTPIFSLNGGPQSIKNPDGPLANYRQNGGPHCTHLCQDPASANPTAYIPEPIQVPSDAQGTAAAPTLHLVSCKDNDSGSSAFYPVSKFISDIKSLKPDPNGQILIGGIIGPPTPVDVGWFPSGVSPQDTAANELWPDQLHSCGGQGTPRLSPHATQFSADGSFADPGIRLDEFIQAFPYHIEGSICDMSYASSMAAIAHKLGQFITPPCITRKIQNDTMGNPMCSVTEHLTTMQGNTQDLAISNCAENGNRSPCWSMVPGGMNCAGVQLKITDTSNTNSATENATVECSLCLPSLHGGAEMIWLPAGSGRLAALAVG